MLHVITNIAASVRTRCTVMIAFRFTWLTSSERCWWWMFRLDRRLPKKLAKWRRWRYRKLLLVWCGLLDFTALFQSIFGQKEYMPTDIMKQRLENN